MYRNSAYQEAIQVWENNLGNSWMGCRHQCCYDLHSTMQPLSRSRRATGVPMPLSGRFLSPQAILRLLWMSPLCHHQDGLSNSSPHLAARSARALNMNQAISSGSLHNASLLPELKHACIHAPALQEVHTGLVHSLWISGSWACRTMYMWSDGSNVCTKYA